MKTKHIIRVLKIFSFISTLILPFIIATPIFAATIFEDGFESGNFSKWTPVVGTPTVTSGDAHHGTYKAVLATGGQYAQVRFTTAPVDDAFMRAYVMFKAFPAIGTETTILGVYNYQNGRYMSEGWAVKVNATFDRVSVK